MISDSVTREINCADVCCSSLFAHDTGPISHDAPRVHLSLRLYNIKPGYTLFVIDNAPLLLFHTYNSPDVLSLNVLLLKTCFKPELHLLILIIITKCFRGNFGSFALVWILSILLKEMSNAYNFTRFIPLLPH